MNPWRVSHLSPTLSAPGANGLVSACVAGMTVIAIPTPGQAVRPGRTGTARDLHHARVLTAEWLQRAPARNVQPAA